MKVYKTQSEIEKDIKDDVLAIDDDVKFECSFLIYASLKISGDINALDINAHDINARDINALDINALDINAHDINAHDINAGGILYYAFCCVYESIKCISIKAKKDVHQEPICLDGKLEYKNEKETEPEIEIDGKKYSKQTIKNALKEYVK